jgi:hypothetical protein
MVAPTCFGITLPFSGSVPSDFWEMLNWRAVDRILWMGVLCLVALCVVIWDRCLFSSRPIPLVFVITNKGFEVSQKIKLLVYLQFTIQCVKNCDILSFLVAGCQHFWINLPWRIRRDQQHALIVPLLYSTYWLIHVSVVACHHQGAIRSSWVTWNTNTNPYDIYFK